jgi:arsenate reductase
MAEITIYHNPNCSTSRYALDTAAEMGVEVDVVKYLLKSQLLEREDLVTLTELLEDPVTDLVRRDGNFKKLGITEEQVADADGVVDTLLAHPELLQRPILVRGQRAIIGRPKDRVAEFIA